MKITKSELKQMINEALREALNGDNASGIDISMYQPSQAVIDKIKDYRDRGSKVNVAAITDSKKFLTYAYAACLIGWDDLVDLVIENQYKFKSEIIEILDKIIDEVEADLEHKENLSRKQITLRRKFPKVFNYLKDLDINYTVEDRRPTRAECEKDSKNGRCYTIGYKLSIGNSNIDFTDHTNEGVDDPSYGFSLGNREFTSKREFENAFIEKIKEIQE